jgi:hypothetical protein
MAVEYVRPECVTALPERGEGRNHDLVMVGKSKKAQVTVCVEAKPTSHSERPSAPISGRRNKRRKRSIDGRACLTEYKLSSALYLERRQIVRWIHGEPSDTNS